MARCCTSTTSTRSRAGIPRTIPRSVLSGRTNDEVAANPERLWTREDGEQPAAARRGPSTPRPPTTSSPRSTRCPRRRRGRSRATSSRSPTSTRCCSRPRDDGGPVTKRDLVRYYASIAPTLLPYLADRPLNLNRFPNGAGTKGFWQKQVPTHAPDWITRWDNTEADRARASSTSSPTAPRRWSGSRTTPRSSCTRGRRASRTCAMPTYALIDLDPGTETTWDELLAARAAAPHRARAPRRARLPEGDGPARHPDLDPDRRRARLRRDPRLGGAALARDRRDRARSRELDVGEARPRVAAPGSTTRRTRSTRRSSRPTAHVPRRARRSRSPITWDELDDPELRPDRWTIRTVLDRLAVRPGSHGADAHRRAAPPDRWPDRHGSVLVGWQVPVDEARLAPGDDEQQPPEQPEVLEEVDRAGPRGPGDPPRPRSGARPASSGPASRRAPRRTSRGRIAGREEHARSRPAPRR